MKRYISILVIGSVLVLTVCISGISFDRVQTPAEEIRILRGAERDAYGADQFRGIAEDFFERENTSPTDQTGSEIYAGAYLDAKGELHVKFTWDADLEEILRWFEQDGRFSARRAILERAKVSLEQLLRIQECLLSTKQDFGVICSRVDEQNNQLEIGLSDLSRAPEVLAYLQEQLGTFDESCIRFVKQEEDRFVFTAS